MPDRHSRVPAQLKNKAWKGVSSGGPECPFVYLCQQHAGKVDLYSCYQCRYYDCSVPHDLIISFSWRHPVTHQ
ncbi:hypothetical protein H5410_050849 [Solanum commersonii]|uniref:Uncharacterized protein n=1 Tax=Solanum commersonii TaxID=4109 RepID=A0A9J5WZ17_SOLCO|nr:hypothetical protein H5410_050849 [Solanum commersonii]